MLSMMKIALRNTRRQLKRSILLGGAIAFGVLVITVLNSFTGGLTEALKQNMAYAFGGHVFISGAHMSDSGRVVGRIAADAVLDEVLERDDLGISSVNRRTSTYATLIFGSRQANESIEGVDFDREVNFVKGLTLRDGDFNVLLGRPDGIILTGLAATKLGVHVGEEILVRLSTVTGQQNVGEFTVVAISEDGGSLGLSSSYAHLSHLNGLVGLAADEYQQINLVLHNMAQADRVADAIYDMATARQLNVERPMVAATVTTDSGIPLSGPGAQREQRWEGTKYALITIHDMMKPIEALMDVLNNVGLGIFVVLLVITMVGIMNTFRMVLIERTAEIGTMRAFGMQRAMVRRIFLWEAGLIALGGGLAGLVLAGLTGAVLSRISVAHIPGMEILTLNGYFNFNVTVGNVLLNLIILLAMSLLAALLPANAAAKLEPVKALSTRV